MTCKAKRYIYTYIHIYIYIRIDHTQNVDLDSFADLSCLQKFRRRKTFTKKLLPHLRWIRNNLFQKLKKHMSTVNFLQMENSASVQVGAHFFTQSSGGSTIPLNRQTAEG